MPCTLTAEQIKSVKPLGFLHNKGTDCFNGRVITVNGKISAHQMETIAKASAVVPHFCYKLSDAFYRRCGKGQ